MSEVTTVRASDPEDARRRWELYQLPDDMTGLTFLDVGCWGGAFCCEALRRGATQALGIDMVKSPALSQAQEHHPFNFLVCDVFSEKFIELPVFDIVLCAGVLYHVEDVVSLLFRLKAKTRQTLVLATEILQEDEPQEIPYMKFCSGEALRDNPSNWWVPNVLCMTELLTTCEFADVAVVFRGKCRACFHGTPRNELCAKILPRREKMMGS